MPWRMLGVGIIELGCSHKGIFFAFTFAVLCLRIPRPFLLLNYCTRLSRIFTALTELAALYETTHVLLFPDTKAYFTRKISYRVLVPRLLWTKVPQRALFVIHYFMVDSTPE